MSTQPISGSLSSLSSSAAGSASTLPGSGTGLQITGLASGLDTNAIISEMMAIDRQPVTNLTNRESGLKAKDSQLQSIQTALQTLAANAQALSDPGLWASTQTVNSSDSTRVSATTATGAGVGGYQVSVTQLANSAQRTFTFASPAAGDTITIDGHQTTLAAGATIQDFVNAINSDSSATVYAATTNANTVVLSSRTTGNTGTNFIQVSDPNGTITEQTALAKQGQDALYSVDGVAGSSSSNTVTGAIAGVSLNFNGITTTSGPITITVGAPSADTASITSAVKAFVDSYNSILSQVQGQLSQTPSSSDPTQGTLYGDSDLTDLLDNLRQAIYTPGAGLPTGVAALTDIGVSTGAASGSAAYSQDSVNGNLTIDSTALANAIQSNPGGVQQMLQSFAQSFSNIVNAVAQPGGSIDQRIQGDNAQLSDMSDQITQLNSLLADKQTALQAQFASLESTLSESQSQSQWLAGQIAQLP